MIRRYTLLPLLALASVAYVQAAPLDNLSATDVNGPAAVAPLEHPQPPAGKHKVTIILAAPTHKPLDHKTLEFTVPAHAPVHHF